MLPVQNAPPISLLQRPDDAPLGLRLNQRLTAEVLQIATDHVVLALEGTQVVARLTSAEQAAALAERRSAQFIVRGLAPQALTLQLVQTSEPSPASPGTPLNNLAAELLRQIGLPADDATLPIAQALLDHNLPVTPELVTEIKQALAQLDQGTQADPQHAAALKAAGLPVSAGTLALVAEASPALAESVARLTTQLQNLAVASPTPHLAQMIEQALKALHGLQVDWSASPHDLALQLRQLVQTLGHSLERDLAGSSNPASPAQMQTAKGLTALAELRAELAQPAYHGSSAAQAVVKQLDQLLDTARLTQFKNSGPTPVPAEGHWLNVPIPLREPAGETAQLRVAYRSEGDQEAIDPAHTRIVLQVDLEDGQAVEVDLSVVERQIGAWITTTSAALSHEAEAELPTLEAALEQLGYHLKTARCKVGGLEPAPDGPPTRPFGNVRPVDLEA